MTRLLFSCLVLVSLFASACGSDADETLSGFERTPLPVVNETTLPRISEPDGAFRFEAPSVGDLLLVYFGYTNCPDVCPTTLADLRLALNSLDPADRDRITTAMVTIDPERDTDEILTGYVQSFLPEAAAVRSVEDADLRRVADAFGADYGVTVSDEGAVDVLHTGSLYAVNAEGELLVSWPFGVASEDIEKDLRLLLKRESA